MAADKFGSVAEWVHGKGGDEAASLIGVIRQAFKSAKGGDHGRVDQIRIKVTAINRDGSLQESSGVEVDVRTNEDPDDVAKAIGSRLSLDPGPGWTGTLKCETRIAGKETRLGSFQRQIEANSSINAWTSEEKAGQIDPFLIAERMARIALASTDQTIRGADANTRMVQAISIGATNLGNILGLVYERLKNADSGSSIMSFLSKAAGVAASPNPAAAAMTAATTAATAATVTPPVTSAAPPNGVKLPEIQYPDQPPVKPSPPAAARDLTHEEFLAQLEKMNPEQRRAIAVRYVELQGRPDLAPLIP